MKTGRVRKKAEPSPPKETAPHTPAPGEEAAPSRPPSKPRKPARTPRPAGTATAPRKSISIGCIFAAVVAVIAILAIIILLSSLGGDREWIEATQASGTWTTSTTVIGPQVAIQDKWETDCINDPNSSVRTGTCLMKDSDTYRDEVRDDYDEYAYSIYYEEAEEKLYEASGEDFVVTQLNEGEDYWEDDRHFIIEEWLDKETCQYTSYTVWITDPEDAAYEAEVVLSECEVFVSVDYGFKDPAVALFWAIDPRGLLIIFDEIYERRLTTGQFVERIKDKLGVRSIAGLTKYAIRHGMTSSARDSES